MFTSTLKNDILVNSLSLSLSLSLVSFLSLYASLFCCFLLFFLFTQSIYITFFSLSSVFSLSLLSFYDSLFFILFLFLSLSPFFITFSILSSSSSNSLSTSFLVNYVHSIILKTKGERTEKVNKQNNQKFYLQFYQNVLFMFLK